MLKNDGILLQGSTKVVEDLSRSVKIFIESLCCGIVFRPSATVSRIGLMESRLRRRCRWCGGPPPHHHGPPPTWYENVMDGWGARPLR